MIRCTHISNHSFLFAKDRIRIFIDGEVKWLGVGIRTFFYWSISEKGNKSDVDRLVLSAWNLLLKLF
jgi:hypothetical protein